MSVFTFDTDPKRISSPWRHLDDPDKTASVNQDAPSGGPPHGLLSEYGVDRLPPEPQEGPIEYKLHLLLRPRRTPYRASTPSAVSGSQHSRSAGDGKLGKPRLAAVSSSGQTRQDRCRQLTTQLLWRLRQSLPYHASTYDHDFDFAPLPDDAALLTAPVTLAVIPAGLEESRGALYEIGVADDGTLVGITQDEMDQSIATLRWMAANLGCQIAVERKVVVGRCEFDDPASEDGVSGNAPARVTSEEDLLVAEVLVKPALGSTEDGHRSRPLASKTPGQRAGTQVLRVATPNQLRATLTGPTTSGKSTLFGTLSTGALDNGHGRARLNSFKHRHELSSGITTSGQQELIGYNGDRIVNYSNRNVESWLGIHDHTSDGRLVFLTDSAGHPRYKRLALRSLVGWAAHWTMVCLAVNDTAGPANQPTTDTQDLTVAADASKAHLEFCLELEIPLVVVITKTDLMDKAMLRRALGPVWTAIRRAGRTPLLLQSKERCGNDLSRIPPNDAEAVGQAVTAIAGGVSLLATVPVVLTSALSGDGMGLVHALLQKLPIPPPPTAHDFVGMALNPEQPASLFHIDLEYSIPASFASVSDDRQVDTGTVISGHLRFGDLSVGDRVVVGPFPSGDDDRGQATPDERGTPSGLSSSHASSSELNRALRHAVPASAIQGEWYTANIVSLRNLRLPVQTLRAGQAGTIGMVLELPAGDLSDSVFERPPPTKPSIRRGMVAAIPSKHMLDTGLQLQAASGLTAVFNGPDTTPLTVGSAVTFDDAFVRATARIASVARHSDAQAASRADSEDIFPVDIPAETRNASGDKSGLFAVRLELLHSRVWIELGSRIVITGKESLFMDGFVGRVVEIVD